MRDRESTLSDNISQMKKARTDRVVHVCLFIGLAVAIGIAIFAVALPRDSAAPAGGDGLDTASVASTSAGGQPTLQELAAVVDAMGTRMAAQDAIIHAATIAGLQARVATLEATPSPTTPGPTGAPSAWVAVVGTINITSENDPAVLLSRSLLSTGRITGDPTTPFYHQITSVTGYLQFLGNPGLVTLGTGFPRLTHVERYLVIGRNHNLATFGAAFPALVALGAQTNNNGMSGCQLPNNGISLSVVENYALTTFGTAFGSLRRICGMLHINSNPLLTDFEALRNLTCHGGVWQNNPAYWCQGCPAWLLAKPQC